MENYFKILEKIRFFLHNYISYLLYRLLMEKLAGSFKMIIPLKDRYSFFLEKASINNISESKRQDIQVQYLQKYFFKHSR